MEVGGARLKDSEFKTLQHCIGTYRISSIGTEVAKGYKPDVTIKDENGQLAFILESEQKTDRKAFLGAFVKAEKYAEDCNARPVLVIVMKISRNTTVRQIADHLSPYAHWLACRKGGILSLSGVFIISDDDYRRSIQANELLTSELFRDRVTVIA